jgi:hypothetical protein
LSERSLTSAIATNTAGPGLPLDGVAVAGAEDRCGVKTATTDADPFLIPVPILSIKDGWAPGGLVVVEAHPPPNADKLAARANEHTIFLPT